MTDVRLYGSVPSIRRTVSEEPPPRSLAQILAPYFAEFLGTFVLVFTVGCCLLAPGDPVWNATAIGCALMVMVYATGPVSGGNLNPAVSLCLALVGALEWPRALIYIVVQLLGGISAGFCCAGLFAPMSVQIEPGPGFSRGYAQSAETVYTCLLCFVVCNCAVSKRNNPKEDQNQFYALAIGFAVVSAGYAVGVVSGACLNPAIALGLDITALSQSTGYGWHWTLAELVGALLAAALFRETRPEEFGPESDLRDHKPALGTRCFAEFLGSFVLVFTVGMNLTVMSPAPAWSAAAALVCMIYSLGNVSGGHFNPAVTLAVVLSGRGRCSVLDGLAYVLAQLAGGVAAGFFYASFHAKGHHRKETFGLQPGAGYGRNAACTAEVFFTFVLAYVVLACATITKPQSWKTKQNSYFALAIGACVAAGGFSVGAISGGEFNPAVCLGVSVGNFAHHGWLPPPGVNGWLFSLSELFGGILAAAVFRRTHTKEFETDLPLPS